MKILIICGHGANDPGACSSYGTERDETRKVGSKIRELLGGYNNVTVDMYPTNRNAYSDVCGGTVQVNFANYDYVFEIHFNISVSSAHGTEIWVTPNESSTSVEQKIVNKVSALGFTNRGVKKEYFAVINAVKNKGVSGALIETCFISNQEDMSLYKNKFNLICNAMVEGIAEGFGLTKKTTTSQPKIFYKVKYCVCYCNDIDKRASQYLAEYLGCECINATIPRDWKNYAENLIAIGGDASPVGFSKYTTHLICGSNRYQTAYKVLEICIGNKNLNNYKK